MTITHISGAESPPQGAYQADIVILSLDRTADTIAAICSALSQTGISRHVVVLDQGSKPEDLAKLAATVAGRSDATLLRAGHNLGVAGGRNAATAFGHGQVILALDNDAEFATPAIAAESVRAMAENPKLAAIGFRVVLFDGGADDLSSWGYPGALLDQSAAAFDAATFVGAGHAISRAAWNAAAGYDESLFFCWEEYDFSLRAIDLGWQIRYRGDLAVRHKVSPERRVAWTGNRWFHFVRNRLYIERKWRASWIGLAPRVMGYLIKGARHRLVGQTLRAVAAAHAMSRRADPRTRSEVGKTYLRINDQAFRGTLVTRLRQEVMSGLPGNRREHGWAPPGAASGTAYGSR